MVRLGWNQVSARKEKGTARHRVRPSKGISASDGAFLQLATFSL